MGEGACLLQLGRLLRRTHSKRGVYFKGDTYWKQGAKLIIMVHVVGQYMNYIDEGRKSNLATINTMQLCFSWNQVLCTVQQKMMVF